MINTLRIYEELSQVMDPKPAQKLASVLGVIYEDLQDTVRRSDFDALRRVVEELATAEKDLAQAQKQTEVRLEELAQAQTRTEQRVEELAQAQNRTEQRVEELAQAQKRTEERLEELAQAQKRTEQRVEELAQAQKRTEERVEQLAEAQKRTEERLEELAQAQKRTEERVEQLAQAQNRTEERLEELAQAQNRTEERVEELAQAQKRTEERMNELAQRHAELAEAQKRTEARLDELARALTELAEAQKRTETTVAELAKRLDDTNRQLGGLAITIGYTLENEAYRALPRLLQKDYQIRVTEPLRRDYVTDAKGRDLEVNILGRGVQEGEQIWIIGEAKAQLSRREVDSFIRTKVKPLKAVCGKIFPVLVAHMVSARDVPDYVRQQGAALYLSYQFSESN